MDGDSLAELLQSPLDDPDPGGLHIGRWWVAGALGVAAVVAIVLVASGGDDIEADASATTSTIAAAAGVPQDRLYSPMVATDSGVFMFGGLQPVQDLDGARYAGVWRYDAATGEWWDLRSGDGPEPRAGEAYAYDAGSDVMVMFGGAVGDCEYPQCPDVTAETWVYDPAANSWERRSPEVSPPARHGHAMAYDSGSDRVVMFGGDSSENWLDDTWAYDTDTDEWTEVATADEPWPRALHAMGYDPVADQVVLWGGADREQQEVWTFDLESAAWVSLEPEPAPDAAWDGCMAWDPVWERMLLIGGEGYTTVEISEGVTTTGIRWRDETWALDLGTEAWTMLERLPQPVSMAGCVADPLSGAIVVWSIDTVMLLDPATGVAGAAG